MRLSRAAVLLVPLALLTAHGADEPQNDDIIIEDGRGEKVVIPDLTPPKPRDFVDAKDKKGRDIIVPVGEAPTRKEQPAKVVQPQPAVPEHTPAPAPEPQPKQEPAPQPEPKPAPPVQPKQPVQPAQPAPLPEPPADVDTPAPPPDTTADGVTPSWLEEDTTEQQELERLNATAEERERARTATPAKQEKDQHVISQSRLFSVSGGDSLRMGAIATHADAVYARLCSLLDLPRDWKNGISIRLVGQPTDQPVRNPVRLRVNIIGGAPNFQIRIHPGGGIDMERLDDAIITMVLYERALRGLSGDAFPDEVNLPQWLVSGIQQAMLWRSGKADKNLYRNLYNRAEMIPPEEIIGIEQPGRLDAASRQIYDVSCGVLVMSLLDCPNGKEQFRSMLEEAATTDLPAKEFIAAHFSELATNHDMLDKWWALELAALSLPKASDALAPLESEKQLADALTVVYFDPETETARTVSIDNAYELMEVPGWENLLRPNIERLVALSATAFPAYRQIVIDYCRVLSALMDDKDPDAAQNTLGPLKELRRAYTAAATRGRDYLDWYEITHLGHTDTRSFDTYLEAMHVLRMENEGVETPISRYLRDIETLQHLKADDPLPESIREQIGKNPQPAGEEAQKHE